MNPIEKKPVEHECSACATKVVLLRLAERSYNLVVLSVGARAAFGGPISTEAIVAVGIALCIVGVLLRWADRK